MQSLSRTLGEKKAAEAATRLALARIDRCWADHLAFVSYVREGIHLTNIGGLDPLDEFARIVTEAFLEMQKKIDTETTEAFLSADPGQPEEPGWNDPPATWTYTVNDNSFEENLGLFLVGNRNIGFSVWAAFFSWPFLLIALIWRRFSGKKAGR